jgi:histidine triad (HIT) family protein
MFNHEPDGYECPLCVVAKGGETELNKKSDIVFEDENVVAYTSPKWWGNNSGNVMVISRTHVENVYDISDDLLANIYIVGKKVALGMKETYGCEGTSFRQHNEPAGNQDVWHFHVHVFPRWGGDDLYLNHKNTRYTTSEERAPYAQKLRDYFSRGRH